ncbi:MAG: iron-containing alcohol dehydrogenase [Pseudoflavonifractor sp.]
MNSFNYRVPTNVIFGKDAECKAGETIRSEGGSHVLVLYGGGSAVTSGLLDRVTASLTGAGLEWSAVGGVKPNPLLEFAQKVVDDYQNTGIDFVLGIGGGSVIDTAKSVAIGLANPQVPIWDYYSKKATITVALPKASVVTLAAAGSETSDSAVLTNGALGEKRGINAELNRPVFALMNPELTYTLPSHQTACGIVDIMMHTMDRYFSCDTDNALTDAIAEGLLRTTIAAGRTAMTDPKNYKARSELMWCGSLSHNGLTGLGQKKDFSVHAIGQDISGIFNLYHAETLSVMWPAWARHVMKTSFPRFAQFGRNVWGIDDENDEACALAGIRATETYFKLLHMPVSLGETDIGVQPDTVIRKLAHSTSGGGTRSVGVFCPLDEENLYAVYASANF